MSITNLASKTEPSDQTLLQQVVRAHEEPYRYFDDWQIHQMLTKQPLQYLDDLLATLQSLSTGESTIELPDKLVFDDADTLSDFRVMPCVIQHPGRKRKTVKLVGTNNHQQQVPDQITVGKAFAMDEKENFVSTGFAGCLLSSARTGACAATAVRLLSTNSEFVEIIGAGRVGYYSALYIAALGKTSKICIRDNVPSRAKNTALLLSQTFPDIEITASKATKKRADIVVLATDSLKAIYGENEQPASLVISVGADTHWQHEVSEQLLDQVSVCVDTLDSFNCGDLRQWHSENRINKDKVTDLLTLLAKKPAIQQPTLFISTGSALFDNLTIDYILQHEQELSE